MPGIENEPGESHPTVELDETKVLRNDRWYHEIRWAFGVYDRGTKKSGIFYVLQTKVMMNQRILYIFQCTITHKIPLKYELMAGVHIIS
ncbi:unnamed protein product [Blepharisma stoltei]|uniref:Uncharacterized protein n=1 Tax=Blepharisma stoltei TaxID=1481888 RepID=A0AAU9ISL7_9CILI|nr:unnamed protein product [Blepharisma stoltei]